MYVGKVSYNNYQPKTSFGVSSRIIPNYQPPNVLTNIGELLERVVKELPEEDLELSQAIQKSQTFGKLFEVDIQPKKVKDFFVLQLAKLAQVRKNLDDRAFSEQRDYVLQSICNAFSALRLREKAAAKAAKS